LFIVPLVSCPPTALRINKAIVEIYLQQRMRESPLSRQINSTNRILTLRIHSQLPPSDGDGDMDGRRSLKGVHQMSGGYGCAEVPALDSPLDILSASSYLDFVFGGVDMGRPNKRQKRTVSCETARSPCHARKGGKAMIDCLDLEI